MNRAEVLPASIATSNLATESDAPLQV